jgi:hypothetical protein
MKKVSEFERSTLYPNTSNGYDGEDLLLRHCEHQYKWDLAPSTYPKVSLVMVSTPCMTKGDTIQSRTYKSCLPRVSA